MGFLDRIKARKPETSHVVLRPSLINSLSLEELSQIEIGKLEQAIKLRSKNLKKLEEQRKETERKLKPYLEVRRKLETGINETIHQIRLLNPESVSTEGIALAKNLYELLGAMEHSDKELKKLGMNTMYSYSTKDLSFDSHVAVVHFLDQVRAKKIFRPTKEKR